MVNLGFMASAGYHGHVAKPLSSRLTSELQPSATGEFLPGRARGKSRLLVGLRKILRLLTPPVFFSLVNLVRRHMNKAESEDRRVTRFVEFSPTMWADLARRADGGYSAEVVLQSVVTAAREVKAGRGAYERDGVVFDEIQYYWPALTGILLGAAKSRGEVRIVDFGGSLGTAYFQNQKFLDLLPDISWTVVEQPGLVSVGSTEFATDRLRFAASLEEAASCRPVDVILCSAALQYVQASRELLSQFAQTTAEFLVLDRVLIHDGDSDLLTLQIVPDWIYNASYPCWVFSRSQLLSQLAESWVVVEEIPALETRTVTESGRAIYWTGFVLHKRTN